MLSRQQSLDFFDTSGVFETCRVKGGVVLRLEEHLDRLRASLKTVGIQAAGETTALKRVLNQAAHEIRDGYVRIAVGRDAGLIVHKHPGVPYSQGLLMCGVAVKTVPTRWPAGDTILGRVKSSERLSSILARLEGGNAFEVLRIGSHGYLTEGTVSNFFCVKKKMLVTPPPWVGVLEGVTRAHVLQAAQRLNISVQEIPVTRHDLFNSDEAFLTNVLIGICPIREVDGRDIGATIPGPMTLKLMRVLQ